LTRIVSGLRAGFKCEHPSEEKRWAAGFSEKQNQRVNLTKAINSDLLFTATEVIGGKHVIRFDFFLYCIVAYVSGLPVLCRTKLHVSCFDFFPSGWEDLSDFTFIASLYFHFFCKSSTWFFCVCRCLV
jgi:hypothetical protein